MLRHCPPLLSELFGFIYTVVHVGVVWWQIWTSHLCPKIIGIFLLLWSIGVLLLLLFLSLCLLLLLSIVAALFVATGTERDLPLATVLGRQRRYGLPVGDDCCLLRWWYRILALAEHNLLQSWHGLYAMSGIVPN